MSAKGSLRIAVLLDLLESDYHADVVAGVIRAANPSRVRTLVVPGGWLANPSQETVPRNFVFDLVPNARVDGLLVLAGSLSNRCGAPYLSQWLARFGNVPQVAVGLDLPGVPSVHVDNDAGVYAVVSHLIEQHGRRRIAFISGPPESVEGSVRLSAYRRALSDHGVVTDERMVVPGGLGREEGRLAILELMDARRFAPPTVDAIVAVNDDVAIGALEELVRRGVHVPAQIALVGFDNTKSARSSNPPMTTVDQRVEQQAYSAARSLIEALERRTPPASMVLTPEPVIRASCGCATRFSNYSASVRPPGGMARTCRLALIERRATIIAELSRAGAGRLGGMTGWEARLVDALTKELASEGDSAFMLELEQVVRRNVALGRSILACHDVLTAFRLQTLICVALEPGLRPRIEDLFQEARLTLSRIGADVERERQQSLNYRMRIIMRACFSADTSAGAAELAQILDEHLPAIGIRAFCIARFKDAGKAARECIVVAQRSTLAAAAMQRTVLAGDLGVTASLEHEDALVIEPLEFAGRPSGIAVLSWGAHDPLHYEQLREALSFAMHAEHAAPEM